MWGNNIIAAVRITEKGFYEFCNIGMSLSFVLISVIKPYLTKKLRREGLDLHRLLALVDNTTVVAMQQCNIWWHHFATFDDIICMTCTFWI